jgi:2-desacetyl-2-hydroxyethyl bacteriochlorophyllide A dehydrogenase
MVTVTTATMQAAILEAPGRMVVQEVPIPEPEPGWVRVRTKASGICGSDLHIYTGNHPWLQPGSHMAEYVLGNIYGHEVAGVVDALGDGVESRAVGDRVAVDAIVPCRECPFCRAGQYQVCPNLKHYGFQYSGGFAEYLLVPAENAVPLPDELSFEDGALLDVLVVGIHATARAGVSLADHTLVIGGGPIGLAAATASARAGARSVTVTARHDLHRRLALEAGAQHVLYTREDSAGLIDRVTGGLGWDVVIEAVGYKADAMKRALDLVRRQGRIVFTGVYEEPVALEFGTLLMKEASIIASHAFGRWGVTPEIDLAVELMRQGRFRAERFVTHRYPLAEINAAFRQKLDHPESTFKVQLVFPDAA